MEIERVTPANIQKLKRGEIFVFGSNINGHHAGGAAATAVKKFGAVWGNGVGIQGQSYAIPTMEGGVDYVAGYVNEFIEYAKEHPDLFFWVTKIGCGIAGFKPDEMAPLFKEAAQLPNIALPYEFWSILENNAKKEGTTLQTVPGKNSTAKKGISSAGAIVAIIIALVLLCTAADAALWVILAVIVAISFFREAFK